MRCASTRLWRWLATIACRKTWWPTARRIFRCCTLLLPIRWDGWPAVREVACTGVVRINVSHPFCRFRSDRPPGRCRQRCRLRLCRLCTRGWPAGDRIQARGICRVLHTNSDPAGRSPGEIGCRPNGCDAAYLYTPRFVFAQVAPRAEAADKGDLRLAIQDEEDWEHVQLILDALGPESLDWQYIASLLDRQPTMRARMADRNRGLLTA